MHKLVSDISKQVLGKELSQLSYEELQQLTEQYPYWNIAQVLRASKETNHRGIASLYVSNPAWFHYVLNADESPAEIKEKTNITDEPKLRDILSSNSAVPENTLTFEPVHTTDYFASQGIKLDINREPNDKFTRQLRSFTDWLKTMKKINPEKLAATPEDDSEKEVQGFAASSIREKEVLTEAMAEVWVKQGNTARAIEMYRKLSLLDPPKSAYFAARIEQLKNN